MCTVKSTAPNSLHWEDFPSLLSLKANSENGYNEAVVNFQHISTYNFYPTFKKLRYSSHII